MLGPFEVECSGRIVTPSAPKLRRVLALLALNAGAVVRTDRIIEELWNDRPPTSALTTLQTYVYQLRKLLVDQQPERGREDDRGPLQTTPGGYILRLLPDDLDVVRFEQLVARGRTLFDAGQLHEASTVLRTAQQVWRGPALGDVNVGPVLEAETLRLDELRSSAAERRIDADLALGFHLELVGELTGLVAAQPTHEGLQAKLMLALHRSGRRSEALLAYQRARAALARELGLEPSRELRELHSAVLGSDRSIEAPAGRGQIWLAGAPSVPSLLPLEVGTLVGRAEPARVTASLLSQEPRAVPPTVVVCGPPGVGSSAFCTRVAHEVADRFVDGQMFAAMLDANGGAVDPAVVLAHFLTPLGVPTRGSSTAADLAATWSSWTAEHAVLVVLDDVVCAEQLTPLLPAGNRCATLLSSRRRIAAPMITMTVELTALPHAAAVDLFTSVIDPARVAAEPLAVRELVELCDGLPLSLRAAAARLALRPHWSVTHLLERLRGLADPLMGLSTEGLDPASSRQRTYRLMPQPARHALDRLAETLSGSIEVAAAADVLGLDEERAEAVLEELVEFQLVAVEERASASRFRYRLRGTAGIGPAVRRAGAGVRAAAESPVEFPAACITA